MPERTCTDWQADMAEVALGVADARERAELLAHLERCGRCRAELGALSEVADGLLALAPPAAPPAGFESAVLAALGDTSSRGSRRRRHRPRLAVATALLAAALGAVGWWAAADLGKSPGAPGTTVVTAALRHGHRAVGEIVVVERSAPWMSVAVDTGAPSATVRCVVTGAGGQAVTVGTFRTDGGYGYWAAPLPAGIAVRGARLVAADGHVLATATLGAGG